MLDADLFSERGSDPAAFADQPPRVLSVHGATTQVGLTAQYLKHLEDSPPTVGKFLGIRRGKSLLIGMITEVTIEMPGAIMPPPGSTSSARSSTPTAARRDSSAASPTIRRSATRRR